ncbi:uncharacterized protein LOC135807195 [Sycon ciliatum]|uniref:uncharacterized protein LOC135807195 n=1 Tax=Sycon ciliatum TaxID=27933 RepID=UPI0031F70736
MLSVTSGQQRWRFDTSAVFLIQLLLFVLYAGTCTATNVNTWVDCGNEGEVFVTNTAKGWVAGEEFCQTLGSHLVSSPQVTACKAMLLGILGKVSVHISYTRLLDKLHFRNVWNNLKVSDNTVTIYQDLEDCSSQYLGDNSQPQDEHCIIPYAIVCGRNTNTQAASIVCDSHMYTYHSISFSADHANQTCYQQYGGRPLSTDGQDFSCASQLLNTSQVLRDNNLTNIPVYTNATNGSHCTTYQPSTNTVGQDSCTKERPTICVSSPVTSSPAVTIDRSSGITDTSTSINSTLSARSENSTDSTITTSRVNKLIMYSTLVTALLMTEIFAAITLIYITYQARN